MSKPKTIGSVHSCTCGCNLTFVLQSANQKYAPECAKREYRKRATKRKHEISRRELRKDQFKRLQPIKRKKAKCNCGCGRPVGRHLRMLSDHCYKHGSDLSEQAHFHTNRPSYTANRR